MKKGQVRIVIAVILILLVIILIAIEFFLFYKPTLIGNVISDIKSQTEELNSEKDTSNSAIEYMRSCMLGCPRECSTCDTISPNCLKSCGEFTKMRNTNNNMNNLNDKNSKWIACVSGCGGDYAGYNCVHSC